MAKGWDAFVRKKALMDGGAERMIRGIKPV